LWQVPEHDIHAYHFRPQPRWREPWIPACKRNDCRKLTPPRRRARYPSYGNNTINQWLRGRKALGCWLCISVDRLKNGFKQWLTTLLNEISLKILS